jgi:peptidoglycan/LPS O-acetylase OafA/YrhL
MLNVSKQDRQLGNLDLLRTVAVLLVVMRHVIGFFWSGGNALFDLQSLGIFGVLIFFVHTCLVLMMSIDRHEATVKASFLQRYVSFQIRRVFRIYPLSIVAVLTVAFVLVPLGLTGALTHISHWRLFSSLALVQDITGTPQVIDTLWSLPLEVQMYLFLPFLFVLAKRGKQGPLFAIWLGLFLLAVSSTRLHLSSALQFPPCFIPGVICYGYLVRQVDRRLPWWTLFAATFALLVVYMAAHSRFGGQGILGAPVCLALGLLIPRTQDIPASYAGLRNFAKTVAKYSYGIYLFHDPCIRATLAVTPHLPLPIGILLALLITAGLSVLGYHALELPMIKLGSRIAEHDVLKASSTGTV